MLEYAVVKLAACGVTARAQVAAAATAALTYAGSCPCMESRLERLVKVLLLQQQQQQRHQLD
jgi:hypothetical protein